MAETADRKVVFTIEARDAFSATFGKAARDVQQLRRELSLPVDGPLTRDQQTLEDAAVNRIRAMERAGIKARQDALVEQAIFGGRPAPGAAAAAGVAAQRPARFSPFEQGVRDDMAKRIREMREAAQATNVQTEAMRRLFGETQKAGGAAATLLDLIRKLGTSSGTDALVEKIAKLAPQIGVALAAAKALSLALQAVNFASDYRRHNRQMNLERQVADDERLEAALTSVPVAGELGRGIADNELLGYASMAGRAYLGLETNGQTRAQNKIAIEELQDATKAQEAYGARLKKRAELETAVRVAAMANVEALKLTIATMNTSAPHANFIKAMAEQAQQLKELEKLPDRGAKIQEVQEEKALRATVSVRALFDLAKADAGNVTGLLAGVGQGLREIAGEAFEKFTDKQTFLADVKSELVEIQKLMAGNGLGAQLEQIRREAERQLQAEKDPDKRRAIEDLAAARSAQAALEADRERARQYDDAHERSLDRERARADVAAQMLGFRTDELALMAQAGDRAAALLAAETDITAQYAARRQALLDILQDEDATAAQKAEAFKAGLNLPAQEALAKAIALAGAEPAFRAGTAPSGASPFLTGAADKSRERVVIDPKVVEALEQAKAEQKRGADLLQKLLDLFNGAPEGLLGLFKGGGGKG